MGSVVLAVYDTSTNFLNVHEWAYGATEVVHIASMALGIGLIIVLDLRLLGVPIGGATSQRLVKATTLGSVIGLVLAITTGMMIFSTDPARYFDHQTMRFKIVVLVAALAFNFTVHNAIAKRPDPATAGYVVAGISLLLWVAIVFSGLFYSFT
jgi:hypothetical protein